MSPALAIGALVLTLVAGSPFASATDFPLQLRSQDFSVSASKACKLLSASFPDLVSFPGEEQYVEDIAHAAVSSQQNATCSVEPQNISDLQLIGTVRTPFAVKSGGHAYNLGQSSTSGVEISMTKFADVLHDPEEGTVTLGVGLTWGEAYEALEPLGIMVAGGRINGIGVGGLSLGGGYSWKTNQFGLTVDTITQFELVLPNGRTMNITNVTNPDLFFGLRGGLNNFGIVTRITYETHPQSLVYGGVLSYTIDSIDAVNAAIANYSLSNSNPKAELLVSYGLISMGSVSQFLINVYAFYDEPTLPAGVFDEFLSLPFVASASNLTTRTFVDFMSIFGSGDLGIGPYGIAQHVVPISNYTSPLLSYMIEQIQESTTRLSAMPSNSNSTLIVSLAPEPFFNAFAHSRGGAYPHPPSRQVTPLSSFIAYQTDPSMPLDAQITRQTPFTNEIKRLTHAVQSKAVSLNLSRWDDILYPNYALSDTPLELMYGENLPRLRRIASRYDPGRIMSLTGGFRFV